MKRGRVAVGLGVLVIGVAIGVLTRPCVGGSEQLPLCGGAPQDLVPFDMATYAAGPPRPERVNANNGRQLLGAEASNGTRLADGWGDREDYYDDDEEGEDYDDEEEGGLEWDRGEAGGARHREGNGTAFVGRSGRRLLRMPYQMKRVGCGRKRRARVYFENADSDPSVQKDVRLGEETLVDCMDSIDKCDAKAYDAASLLEVRKKVMSLFKPGPLGARQYKTCAIVGNAGHMVKKKYGKYIDNHDLVMRFNTQALGRFKDKVGSKVTMRILNNFHTTQACCRGKLPEGKGKSIDMVLWFPAARVEMRRVCKKKYPNHKLVFLSRRFIGKEVMVMRELRKEMKRLGFGPFGGWKQLTSGAHGLLMLLTMCDQVSVYGLTTYKQSQIDQYGGRGKKTKNGNSWHDWKGEQHVWRLLHAMKEVSICSM
ncbi:sialyltransferase [Chloropicon primus]|uniref:beta-galactoside alpha-(2,6)-sialyltransferase n=1 Tax=Chloropicon primus TaxID=1764295 RepID=A0A5B8MXN2_9CHLO|nr:sialyltransferase [Chloropicon primus]|eukprot:QDZ25359.1 sialyltransferase [Chloropicon primus]